MASSFLVICADFSDTGDAESLFTLTYIQVWTRNSVLCRFSQPVFKEELEKYHSCLTFRPWIVQLCVA